MCSSRSCRITCRSRRRLPVRASQSTGARTCTRPWPSSSATPNGGGFGGKSDIFSHELVAAKLAIVTGRPVKITLTREEVFYAHRGRHPVLMKVKTGFTRDGRITAMQFQSFLDGGGYGSYGVASTYYTGALQATTYAIPRYRF